MSLSFYCLSIVGGLTQKFVWSKSVGYVIKYDKLTYPVNELVFRSFFYRLFEVIWQTLN